MSFIRKFETLMRKSNKDIANINLDKGIEIYNYSPEFNLRSSQKILEGIYTFADLCFDINEDDTLYGLVSIQKSNLMYLYINDKIILKNMLLNYDSSIFTIKFPYIKKIDDVIHILYYLVNNSGAHCTLIHYCNINGKWIKNEIDTSSYTILSNFNVIFKGSIPIIFYFKIVNNYEELFVSIFDLSTNSWSKPCQVTNSNKSKVYLSVIMDSKNNCHIAFSENNSRRYYCTYIKGYINDNQFIIYNYQTISKTVACTFPNLIQCKNMLYLQWIEYSNLYTSISYDMGKTWLNPFTDNLAYNNPFKCYSYKSNYHNDIIANSSAIFAYNNSIEILGLKK